MFSHDQEREYYKKYEAQHGSTLDRTQIPVSSGNVSLGTELGSLALAFARADTFYVTGITAIPPVEVDPHGPY